MVCFIPRKVTLLTGLLDQQYTASEILLVIVNIWQRN